jgi:hypothetical protein
MEEYKSGEPDESAIRRIAMADLWAAKKPQELDSKGFRSKERYHGYTKLGEESRGVQSLARY